jgi:hypothetical protein
MAAGGDERRDEMTSSKTENSYVYRGSQLTTDISCYRGHPMAAKCGGIRCQ